MPFLRGDTGFRVSPLKILIVSGTASSLSRLLYVQCTKYRLRHCRRLRQPKRHRHIDMKAQENLWQHTVDGSEFPNNHLWYKQTPVNNGINYQPQLVSRFFWTINLTFGCPASSWRNWGLEGFDRLKNDCWKRVLYVNAYEHIWTII